MVRPNDRRGDGPAGFLSRLRRDTAGNTLVIGAASMIPLAGMAGSAIDMGRAYLVKTRLQQACDAGVLAARKSMSGEALFGSPGDTVAQDQGRKFFTANLRNGMYGAQSVSFVMSDVMTTAARPSASGAVHGVANATVPTTIMSMFGVSFLPMQAICDADLSVGNNDVMFALDLTGSMACPPAQTNANCDNYVPNNTQLVGGRFQTTLATGSRLAGLQTAVQGFFTALEENQPPGTRLRIGFLPYSSGVNVWNLLPATTRQAANANYQTRVANFNTSIWLPQPIPNSAWTGYGSTETFNLNGTNQLNRDQCDKYGTNATFTYVASNGSTQTFPGGTNPTVTPVKLQQVSQPNITQRQYRRKSGSTNATPAACQRESRTATIPYNQAWQLTNWTYQNRGFALANVFAGTTQYANMTTISGSPNQPYVTNGGTYDLIALATEIAAGRGFNMSRGPTVLDGCVEERQTNPTGINDVANGSNASMLWRPTWREMTAGRAGPNAETRGDFNTGSYYQASSEGARYGNTAYSCPKAAQQLQEMTAQEVTNYVTAADFTAHGLTYHDVGMIWAARLMAPTGPFSANHIGPANGKPVNRHIIFMTDGDMKPLPFAYSSTGIEVVDRRIASGTTNLDALKAAHNARFAAACTAAKVNSTVWVVAFGPPLNAAGQRLTPELSTCATSSAHAFSADSSDALLTTFQRIAQKIGDLRLTA